jgi:hypothetical protein
MAPLWLDCTRYRTGAARFVRYLAGGAGNRRSRPQYAAASPRSARGPDRARAWNGGLAQPLNSIRSLPHCMALGVRNDTGGAVVSTWAAISQATAKTANLITEVAEFGGAMLAARKRTRQASLRQEKPRWSGASWGEPPGASLALGSNMGLCGALWSIGFLRAAFRIALVLRGFFQLIG